MFYICQNLITIKIIEFSIYRNLLSLVFQSQYFLQNKKHILFNRYLISLVEKFKIISVIHYFLRTIWINNYLTKAKACIFEWSDSGVINLRESKLNKIPTICLPHGYNVYTNYDINDTIMKKYNIKLVIGLIS